MAVAPKVEGSATARAASWVFPLGCGVFAIVITLECADRYLLGDLGCESWREHTHHDLVRPCRVGEGIEGSEPHNSTVHDCDLLMYVPAAVDDDADAFERVQGFLAPLGWDRAIVRGWARDASDLHPVEDRNRSP
jgi:hypothetical protein